MFDIGNRIREIRQTKGMTLLDLSLLSNLTQAYISQLENNQRSPSWPTITKLCKAFSMSVPDFFNVDLKDSKIEQAEIDAEARLDVLSRINDMEKEIKRLKKDVNK